MFNGYHRKYSLQVFVRSGSSSLKIKRWYKLLFIGDFKFFYFSVPVTLNLDAILLYSIYSEVNKTIYSEVNKSQNKIFKTWQQFLLWREKYAKQDK